MCAQPCLTFWDPTDYIAHQAPLSVEFSRQEYWSELSFPSLRASLALAGKLPLDHLEIVYVYLKDTWAFLVAQWQRICLPSRRLMFSPWVGKIPWRRNGNPLQYSCLGNPMDRGVWQPMVHGVAKSWTWLSD